MSLNSPERPEPIELNSEEPALKSDDPIDDVSDPIAELTNDDPTEPNKPEKKLMGETIRGCSVRPQYDTKGIAVGAPPLNQDIHLIVFFAHGAAPLHVGNVALLQSLLFEPRRHHVDLHQVRSARV